MESNKHTKFENLIKNQFENHEVEYNNDDWLDFEKNFKNQLPSENSNFGSKISKIDLKSLLIIFSMLSNIVLVVFFITFIRNEKFSFANKIKKTEKVIFKHLKNYYLTDTFDLYIANNQNDVSFNQNYKSELTEKNQSESKYENISENIDFSNSIIKNYQLPLIDTVVIEKIQITEAQSDEIITYKEDNVDTTEIYSIYVADKKPKFKDKKGNYQSIEYLPDYINSEFQPSNLDKKTYGDFTVFLTFTITKEGEIKDIQKIRKSDEKVDKEAIRILNGMSAWIPAEINNEKVDVVTNLTIRITIKENNPFPNF